MVGASITSTPLTVPHQAVNVSSEATSGWVQDPLIVSDKLIREINTQADIYEKMNDPNHRGLTLTWDLGEDRL
jgi:hypothetical protein